MYAVVYFFSGHTVDHVQFHSHEFKVKVTTAKKRLRRFVLPVGHSLMLLVSHVACLYFLISKNFLSIIRLHRTQEM